MIFVCENNQWAISTPFQDAVNVPDVAIRANGYGFPGEVVDGNDFFAVREAAERAVARARAGEGPTLIEAKTYRITPHSAATPNDNRPPEELELWRSRDPIVRFAASLVERQLVAAERRRRARGGGASRGGGGDRVRARLAVSGARGGRDGRLRPERRGTPTAGCDEHGGRDTRADDVGGAQRGAPRGDAPRRRRVRDRRGHRQARRPLQGHRRAARASSARRG